jgi:hypothetical protein
MTTDLPRLIEYVWATAPVGREVACLNEALRSLLALIEERRPPPRWPCRRMVAAPA